MVFTMEAVKHVYDVRRRKDKRGVDLMGAYFAARSYLSWLLVPPVLG